jgi:hypothetical protein
VGGGEIPARANLGITADVETAVEKEPVFRRPEVPEPLIDGPLQTHGSSWKLLKITELSQ